MEGENAAPVAVVDARGMPCPGPIIRLSEKMAATGAGGVVEILATDPAFPKDMEAFARITGNETLLIEEKGGVFRYRIKKKASETAFSAPSPQKKNKVCIIIFSGEMDRVMAAFIIATGALALGKEVSLFFTFWGLNALKKEGVPGEHLFQKAFNFLTRGGMRKLPLSKLHMAGAGPIVMKSLMRKKGAASLEDLLAMAKGLGARIRACELAMGILGITKEDLIEEVDDVVGVAAFLGEASDAEMTLFV